MKLLETTHQCIIKMYIPKEYLHYEDGERKPIGIETHANAKPPSYCYDEKVKKWRLDFTGADSGGCNIADFAFYFDSEEDIFRFLKQ